MATLSEIKSRYDRAIEQACTIDRLEQLQKYLNIDYDLGNISKDDYDIYSTLLEEREDEFYNILNMFR